MIRLVIAMRWENELKHTAIMLDAIADFSLIGAVSDSYQTLRLIESKQPDIVILDYYLDQTHGLDLIPIIKHRSPGTSVIIISPYNDANLAWNALNGGASAYIIRKFDMSILTGIIHVVHTGGRYISSQIFTRILPKFHRYQELFRGVKFTKNEKIFINPKIFINLSPTEWQIIEGIKQGKSTKEIAETLNLKNGTVRNYISSMMKKTGGRSRAQLIYFALDGLVE